MDFYSSDSNDSSGPQTRLNTLDYTYQRLSMDRLKEKITDENSGRDRNCKIQRLLLYNNNLSELPSNLTIFHCLRHVDLGNNRLSNLPEFLTRLPLVTLNLRNNFIKNDSLPKTFLPWSHSLRKLNLGGNLLTHFPGQCLELESLQQLYIGSNQIEELPRSIDKMSTLTVLCLGGNRLTEVPATLGNLNALEVLIINDNKLESLPATIACLKKLKTLQIHKNQLRTLPTEIIALKCLSELSLRENPLVVKFVNDMTYNPGTLLEISARTVKVQNIPYNIQDMPQVLIDYLDSAHHCLNPKCNGVFFDNRVEHIKFVDFCGKYRVPLLQYLCSAKCVSEDSSRYRSPDNEKTLFNSFRVGLKLLPNNVHVKKNLNFYIGSRQAVKPSMP